MPFDSFATAAKMRDVILDISESTIKRMLPDPLVGKVVGINTDAYTAEIVFAGDTGSINARFTPSLIPKATGVIVRIKGRPGDYYISDILNAAAANELYDDLPGRVGQAELEEEKFFQDIRTTTATGTQTVNLTYQPILNSEHLYWNGVYQPDSEWSRAGKVVTVPDSSGYIKVGDTLQVEYSYRDTDQLCNTLVTVKPSSGVYTMTPGLTNFDVQNGLTANPVGAGLQLSDDSDASYTPMVGYFTTGRHATIAAVDFAPVEGAFLGPNDYIGLSVRLQRMDTSFISLYGWNLRPLGGSSTQPTNVEDFADIFWASTPTVPTSFAPNMNTPGSGTGWEYPIPSGQDWTTQVRTQGFSLAFSLYDDSNTSPGVERYRIFEVAVTLLAERPCI